MTDLWRLHVVKGTSTASGGDVEFYESREKLEDALFAAAVEAEANYDSGHRADGRRWRWFKRWFDGTVPDADERKWRVKRIVSVKRLVNGEWEDVEWRIEPPRLVFVGES